MRLVLRSLALISALSLAAVAHAETFNGTATFSDTSSTNNFYDFSGSFAHSPFTFNGTVGTTYTDQLTITSDDTFCLRGCLSPSDNLAVTIAFTNPSGATGGFGGTGTDYLTWLGFVNNSDIDWTTNSQTVTFSDGSSVQLTLPDFTFSGLNDGSISGTEDLKIKVLSGPTAATPEPSSLALLGTGVLGLAGMVRRKYAR